MSSAKNSRPLIFGNSHTDASPWLQTEPAARMVPTDTPCWGRCRSSGGASRTGVRTRGAIPMMNLRFLDTRGSRRTRAMAEIHARRVLIAAVLMSAAASLAAGPVETSFLSENEAAMKTMMAAMRIRPTGDVDTDFVAMMVPHHQGAIDMARAELRHGRNEQLRRIAQEIIVTQQQEITALR